MHFRQTLHLFSYRFVIEKKLRDAKRREKEKKRSADLSTMTMATVRSLDRRKAMEDRAFGKKLSALQDLKAKRQKKQGEV